MEVKSVIFAFSVIIILLQPFAFSAENVEVDICDSFSNREKLESLVPINISSPEGSGKKNIDELIQQHIKDAVVKLNDKLKKDKELGKKLFSQCDQISEDRRRKPTELESEFAKILHDELKNFQNINVIQDSVLNANNFSVNQFFLQQERSLYKSQKEHSLVFRVLREEKSEKKKYILCSDKLRHFFHEGYNLFTEFHRMKPNVAQLVREKNETGDTGNGDSKGISYSRASAEFYGLRFYKELFYPSNGLMRCDFNKEKIVVDKKFALSNYVNSLWDESFNCTQYRSEARAEIDSKIKKALNEHKYTSCPMVEFKAMVSEMMNTQCKNDFSPQVCAELISKEFFRVEESAQVKNPEIIVPATKEKSPPIIPASGKPVPAIQ